MIKLPKHVHRFVDRHGHPRFYLRNPAMPRATLPGLPWSPEFMAAYRQRSTGEAVPAAVGAS